MTTFRMAEPRLHLPQIPDSPSRLPALSRHASAVDYDAAQQLIQHSQEGRVNQDDGKSKSSLNGVGERHEAQGVSNTNDSALGEETGFQTADATRSSSLERPSDLSYQVLNKSPALGQTCR